MINFESVSSISLATEKQKYDGLAVMYSGKLSQVSWPAELANLQNEIPMKFDLRLDNRPVLLSIKQAPGSRLLCVPLGSIGGDVDDVRRYGEASRLLFKECQAIGISKPL